MPGKPESLFRPDEETYNMAPRKRISFHNRVRAALKDLDEKIEVSDKDILGEAARLYKYLYEETVREMGTEPDGDAETEDVTEISLD
jgi:hypothetical protein